MPAQSDRDRALALNALPLLATDEQQAVASSGSIELPVGGAGWRYEVTASGKYWQWRKGSGKQRQSVYGGRFETLPPERRMQYEQRKQAKNR